MTDMILIDAASAHNLKQLCLEIPRNQLVALTGPSGSGKSSLAFDTLFREGQRRYLETLSAQARRFAQRMNPVEAELKGLSPAVAVGQQGVSASARSTVGTLSETYDYLRLLFGRLGQGHCLHCGTLLSARSTDALCELLLARYDREELQLLAPLVEDHRGARTALLQQLDQRGFQYIYIDGLKTALAPLPQLDAARRHSLELPLGQLRVAPGQREALLALLDQAVALGARSLVVVRGGLRELHGLAWGCGHCGEAFPPIGARLFSFNSAHGACPACAGLGVEEAVSEEALIADAQKTLRQGALVPTLPNGYIVYSQVTVEVMDQICRAHGFDVDTPLHLLTPEQRHVVFYGSQKLKVPFGKHELASRMKWSGITAKPREEGFYKGLIPVIEETLKRNRNANILRFVRARPCRACGGGRLRPEALAVTFAGQTIDSLAQMPFQQLRSWLAALALDPRETPVAAPILAGLSRRLQLLERLGLGYLTMARSSVGLAGGEGRRLRIAREMSAELRGMLYVLDEPSMGLHARDKQRLLDVLLDLRDRGNSVLTVEHDLALLVACDWVVDLGPGAGKDGGELLYNGPPQLLVENARPESATRRALLGEIAVAAPKRRSGNGHRLTVHGARAHNLAQLTVSFPLGCLNLITGVSGAGKSTLLNGILAPALKNQLHGSTLEVGEHERIEGAEQLGKVIHIDAAPIGRTPRSNPATYSGVSDPIRDLFAQQPEALRRGFAKRHFSTNTEGGRCAACAGAGETVIGMHGLADVTIRCETCQGQRFHEDVLQVRVKGLNISQVLDLSAAEALQLFGEEKRIARILQALVDVGLGYLSLGQSSLTLSGGEAQRVKLASELARPASGKTLYLLDEPTSGLHPVDVVVLLDALNLLVDKGHTVIAVEHHLDVIAAADHVVDLGPESGAAGGNCVAAGPPESIAACAASLTGAALRARGQNPLKPRSHQAAPERAISMGGVTTHNLKGIDVSITPGTLTVITGLSGSGKTSLAFDTLYAESRSRFAESLSSQARRSLRGKGGGQAERLEGLFPAVAVTRSRGAYGSHATVATMSGIAGPLRILFSRMGIGGAGALSARHFSFNHSDGACPSCGGSGQGRSLDPSKLITNPQCSLWQGAMDGSKTGRFYGDPHGQHLAVLAAAGAAVGHDLQKPWSQLSEAARACVIEGSGTHSYPVTWRYKRGKREGEHRFESAWLGLRALIDDEYRRKQGQKGAADLAALMELSPCSACAGTRLKPEARAVRIADRNLPQLLQLPLQGLHDFLAQLDHPVAVEVFANLKPTLNAIQDLGLGYLSGDRHANSLSGGETQRLRLASQLGGELVGLTYILDEPTHGLHSRDTERLIAVLRRLVARGNTLVVVEHDQQVIEAADQIIELGPGAGAGGGQLLVSGTPAQVAAHASSPTGQMLRGELCLPSKAPYKGGAELIIEGARHNNLKNLDLRFPIGAISVVEGVSGSGKSSLVFGTLAASARSGKPTGCDAIKGLEQFTGVIALDQLPLASGGNPLTHLGLFDAVRKLYGNSADAKAAGLTASAFSPRNQQGRCETCAGSGQDKTAMDFLEDVVQACESCEGKRYNPKTLAILYRAHTIAALLELTVSEAKQLLEDQPELKAGLELLEELGLGYLRVGQETRTLSGGEAQRLKLAGQLWQGRKHKGQNLYLLDEPTSGLHLADIAHLLKALQKLTEAGHTLIIIEHHPAVIAAAQTKITLGPKGGDTGGYIISNPLPNK